MQEIAPLAAQLHLEVQVHRNARSQCRPGAAEVKPDLTGNDEYDPTAVHESGGGEEEANDLAADEPCRSLL